MYNGMAHIVLILTRDVVEDEELLVDYQGTSGEEGKKQVKLCRCNSKQCRVFLEKDHCKTLESLLKGFSETFSVRKTPTYYKSVGNYEVIPIFSIFP
jgi:hypothetical protein